MCFNKKQEVEKIFKELKNDCLNELAILQTPFLFICAVADDGKQTEYKKVLFGPGPTSLKLSQDYFREVLNVFNGFETVYSKPRAMAQMQATEDIRRDMPDVVETYGEESIRSILGDESLEAMLDTIDDDDAVDADVRQMLFDAIEKEKNGNVEPDPGMPKSQEPKRMRPSVLGLPDRIEELPTMVSKEMVEESKKKTDLDFAISRFSWEGTVPDKETDKRQTEQYKDIDKLCAEIKQGDDSFGRVIEARKRKEQERKEKKEERENDNL